jgi:hypothetical protein
MIFVDQPRDHSRNPSRRGYRKPWHTFGLIIGLVAMMFLDVVLG